MRRETGDVHTFRSGGQTVTTAGDTCVGNRYPANFDVLHVDAGLPFVAVADGMGGGRGSAVAGRTALDTLVEQVRAAGPGAGPERLRAAVELAQDRVLAAGAELGELTGCTLTALLADPERTHGWIVQVGDSRAYRLRGELLELLTVDHTAAWLGLLYGWFAPDSPEAHAARYRLTRFVGHPDRPEPDLLQVSLRPGDVYLLCTDGVAEQVDYQRLGELLRAAREEDPAQVLHRMMADTLAAGGADNATAAILRVAGPGGAHRR
jgi:serine/threonine protein phosphatase PrpC